ncbi:MULTISPECIES: methyl-accepting chemotaxis protein [Comamonas]|uniref:methyl-accepting chemotaxis protein n=1 Tax=Comamonas TaxID=283 RepID=UPI00257BB851|nr:MULTISPECIES: methyl-accepting chemotaxis protein [Comamonas]
MSSLWGLTRTQSDFDAYLSSDQAVVTQLQELYAQGLQSGQAVRNIVLNPADQQAVQNLRGARDAYDSAYADVRRRVQGTALEDAVGKLQALRTAQSSEQDKVVVLASQDQQAATAALKANETPAWRELRGALLQQLQAAREAAHASHEATRSAAQRMQWWSAGLALLAVVVAAALLWVMVRTMRQELGGDPADARAALRRVADGDLSDDQRVGKPLGLMAELQGMRQSLRELVQQVQTASAEMLHASSEIAQGNADLSMRTESQASALEETAASMEQLNVTVRQNADNAQTANQLALSASDVAQQGGTVVERVVDTMKGISASSHRIADIINVIDGIAFQTNILALNAAVEAARAGEQGRGFAVVASEVRALAKRSADAAKEIKDLITTSLERVENGSTLADQAGGTMQDMVGAIRRVTDIMGEISAASHEQSSGVAQVGEAITQMDQATQQNAALVEESAAAAQGLRNQAESLLRAISRFQLERGAASFAHSAPAAEVLALS